MATIRAAVEADGEDCAWIHIDAMREMTFLPQDLHTDAETLAWMRDTVFATQQVLVAEDGEGGVAAYLAQEGDMVTGLYVRADRRGQGIGAALIEAAKTRTPGGLRLWVFQPNTGAIRFYLRHGFRPLRRTDGRDNDEKVPDLLMGWPGRPRPSP